MRILLLLFLPAPAFASDCEEAMDRIIDWHEARVAAYTGATEEQRARGTAALAQARAAMPEQCANGVTKEEKKAIKCLLKVEDVSTAGTCDATAGELVKLVGLVATKAMESPAPAEPAPADSAPEPAPTGP